MNGIKTVLQNIGFSSLQLGYFQLVFSIFILCSKNGEGGAIYFNNYLSNISLLFCSFDRCSITGTYHGGAVCIVEAYDVRILSNCFFKCQAYRCPSILIWGNYARRVRTLNFNETSDSDNLLSGAGSAFYANLSTLLSFNNFSNLQSNEIAAGFFVGSGEPDLVSQFITVSNVQGTGITTFWPCGTPQYNEIRNINYISCKTQSTGFISSYMQNNCLLTTIVFINSSFNKLYTRYSTGLLEIYKSLFEDSHSSSNFLDCILTDCYYQSKNIPIIHKVFNTNICWESTIMVKNTFYDIKPFIHVSHLLFNMFMNVK